MKLTEPEGAEPVTVAVKVTLAPAEEGLAELASPVLVVTLLTTWETAALLDAALDASPA